MPVEKEGGRTFYRPVWSKTPLDERTWEEELKDGMEFFRWFNFLVSRNPQSKSRRDTLEVSKRRLASIMRRKPKRPARNADFNPFNYRRGRR